VSDGLRAAYPLTLAFDRAVGGATGAFLAGLADGRISGSRGPGGRVSVPPVEGEEVVPVSDVGTLRAWAWVAEPDPRHPLDHPFAFALVQLDGADTSLLHVVDVEREDALVAGLRVRADWRAERRGSVLDLRAFVPGVEPVAAVPPAPLEQLRVTDDRVLDYSFEPGLVPSAFYGALADGRIEGGRCPSCMHVHVPSHARCAVCGGGPMSPVPLVGTGTIVAVTVVHIPTAGLDVELPFAWARILLDGADVPVPHVIGDADLATVTVGRRVEPVWAPAAGRPPSWEAIRHFRPVAS
jgi:uncharacterized OB-fold protein